MIYNNRNKQLNVPNSPPRLEIEAIKKTDDDDDDAICSDNEGDGGGKIEYTQVKLEQDEVVPSSQPLMERKRKLSDIMNELLNQINEAKNSVSQLDHNAVDIKEEDFFSNIDREFTDLKKICTTRISEITLIHSKTEKTVKRILEKVQTIDKIHECESVGCENNSLNITIHNMKNCQHGFCSDCYLTNQHKQNKFVILCPICNK